MFHVYWPAAAALTLLVVLVIMIILMYGDLICARVQTQTDQIIARRYREQEYRQPSPASMELRAPPPPRKISYSHEIEV